MSSDVVAVRPADAPRPRSVFGPLVMVVLGIVFLMVNAGRLGARSVFVVFAEYWPVFLILWGVVKLVEHGLARRAGVAAPGLGFGGVFLLVLLVLAGSAASSFYRHSPHINWAGVREELHGDNDVDFLLGQRFEYTRSLDHAFPARGTLRVVADRGSMRVLPSPDGQLHLSLRKTVLAYERAEADAIEAKVVPEITTQGDSVVIDATRRSEWSGTRLQMEILVPPNAALDLRTTRGHVEVRGRQASVKAHVVSGDVTLEDLVGNALVELRHGDLTARNVRGDVVVDGRIEDAVLSKVDGAVELRGHLYGHVRADAVSRGVRLHSERTDMEIARLDGDLVMGDGSLRVTEATGPLSLRTRSKDVDLERIKGDVKVENRNGETEIEPHPKAPLGNIDVSSRSGTVRLTLPASAGFSVDARTDHGDIRSDFDLESKKDGEDVTGTGIVNKGGATVSVVNEHGSIRIRRN